MRFTPFLAPGSQELLNFRVLARLSPCPHCQASETLNAHGYLHGFAAEGHHRATRALRFFCSNRYSKLGCGRTFSVYWQSVIPFCSLMTGHLLALLRATATAPSKHAAWRGSPLQFSFRCACRWLVRWQKLTSHVRPKLEQIIPPPGKTDHQVDPFTLRHLILAFPDASCPIACFQSHFQVPITG